MQTHTGLELRLWLRGSHARDRKGLCCPSAGAPPCRMPPRPASTVCSHVHATLACTSLRLNPLLEPHLKLRPYGLNVTTVGMLLAAICLVYTLTALPIGWLTDMSNKGHSAGCRLRALMLCGWACTLCSSVLLAPGGGGGGGGVSASGKIKSSLWPLPEGPAHIALVAATLLLGAGAALVLIPSLPDMQRGLGTEKRDDERRTALCALWNGAYAGGSAVGPLLATMVYARLGWSAIVIAQAVLSLGAMALLLVAAALPEPRG